MARLRINGSQDFVYAPLSLRIYDTEGGFEDKCGVIIVPKRMLEVVLNDLSGHFDSLMNGNEKKWLLDSEFDLIDDTHDSNLIRELFWDTRETNVAEAKKLMTYLGYQMSSALDTFVRSYVDSYIINAEYRPRGNPGWTYDKATAI
jgi:hypothetical protein